LLGAYIDEEIASGSRLLGRADICNEDTVRQYLSAAVSFLFPNHSGNPPSENPYLAEILASRHDWKKPQHTEEPVLGPTLDCMCLLAQSAIASGEHGWLLRDTVLYDFCVLSLITCSCLAKYDLW
jgi:hypothetical protein